MYEGTMKKTSARTVHCEACGGRTRIAKGVTRWFCRHCGRLQPAAAEQAETKGRH